MDLIVYHLGNVNWLAVLLATFASFVVGGLWYSPVLFGKQWMKEVGLKEKDMGKDGMVGTFLVTGMLALVMATGLATLMQALVLEGWLNGALLGLLIGVVFVSANRGVHSLFDRQGGSTLYLINFGHDIVFLMLAGGIIGAL